jgi:hypothetical protein
VTYVVRGSYFESCNCEAICPCRMIGGVPGGRSTHGICYGILSWLVEEGRVDDTDVSGLAAALVYRYDDDESARRGASSCTSTDTATSTSGPRSRTCSSGASAGVASACCRGCERRAR